MTKILAHIRANILSGLLAVIPILLCTISVLFLYQQIDRRVMVFLDQYVAVHHIPGFGIFLLLFFLLFIGIVASHLVGKQIFNVIEYVFSNIPVVKQVYMISNQISKTLEQDENHDVFKKTVLINYPNRNQWTIAFLTGRVRIKDSNEEWLRVFVPMAHPVIGFVYVVKESQVQYPGWSVDQALKMIITLGLISPKKV